jgi:hypothetical protein
MCIWYLVVKAGVSFSLFSKAGSLLGKHRHLHLLVDSAKPWKGWNSVQQLSHHSFIREKLLSFWADVRYLSFAQ